MFSVKRLFAALQCTQSKFDYTQKRPNDSSAIFTQPAMFGRVSALAISSKGMGAPSIIFGAFENFRGLRRRSPVLLTTSCAVFEGRLGAPGDRHFCPCCPYVSAPRSRFLGLYTDKFMRHCSLCFYGPLRGSLVRIRGGGVFGWTAMPTWRNVLTIPLLP